MKGVKNMKSFFAYGVDYSEEYPDVELYGVFSSRDRVLKHLGKQRALENNENKKFCFKAFELDKPWKSELYIPQINKV